MTETEKRIWFRLERREDFNPAGKWMYVRSYPEAEEGVARTYLDGANAKHPGIWRLVKSTEELTDVIHVEIEAEWVVRNEEEIL